LALQCVDVNNETDNGKSLMFLNILTEVENNTLPFTTSKDDGP